MLYIISGKPVSRTASPSPFVLFVHGGRANSSAGILSMTLTEKLEEERTCTHQIIESCRITALQKTVPGDVPTVLELLRK